MLPSEDPHDMRQQAVGRPPLAYAFSAPQHPAALHQQHPPLSLPGQQARLQGAPSSYSSSYNSHASAVASFTNSPTRNPPSFLHRDSLDVNTPTQRPTGPTGPRPSLLTSKLQQAAANAGAGALASAGASAPLPIPSSYSSNYSASSAFSASSFTTPAGSFPPKPTPAQVTTNLSRDTAFSTHSSSSSSTLYQDSHEYPRPPFISQSVPIQLYRQPIQQQQQQPPLPPPQIQEAHLDIANHSVQDLLLMLSALLQKIVEANDVLHTEYEQPSNNNPNNGASSTVLAFHGRNIPAISLHAYLTRILKYCPVTNDVFLSLLVYFDRIAKRANQNAASDLPLFVIDSYNIHRLIISGITVASKFFSDVFYKNSRYAKVGGLPLEELNHLELQFLLLLDFKLMIQVEEMNRYGDLLLKFWRREHKRPGI